MKVKRDWLLVLLVGVLVLIVGVGLLVKPLVEKEGELARFPDRGVPRINITLNGVSLDEIKVGSKEAKYEGNELSLYEGDEIKEFGGVEVKGRGNGTWTQEKKPYQIKFENKVDLFGMGKAKKWVLLANAMDASNLRTEMAVYLEEMLGMEYVMRGEFVELYTNGEYEGLYYLAHAVEIGKNAVNLKDSMGVLVELDNLYWGTERYYESGNGDHLVVKDVVGKGEEDEAMKWFMQKYNEFERAVAEKDYAQIGELVDVESFAKYYLLSEFSVNPDAYWTSFYMYKDGVDDKIHAGPGWDFDLTFANRRWANWMGEGFYSPVRTLVRKSEVMGKKEYEEMGLMNDGGVDWYDMSLKLSHVVFDLMEVPEFREEVKRVYNEQISGRGTELAIRLRQMAEKIADLAKENEKKWSEEELYWQEVERMEEWIGKRYTYFEGVYGDNSAVAKKML